MKHLLQKLQQLKQLNNSALALNKTLGNHLGLPEWLLVFIIFTCDYFDISM